jgi:hypothetical protein
MLIFKGCLKIYDPKSPDYWRDQFGNCALIFNMGNSENFSNINEFLKLCAVQELLHRYMGQSVQLQFCNFYAQLCSAQNV